MDKTDSAQAYARGHHEALDPDLSARDSFSRSLHRRWAGSWTGGKLAMVVTRGASWGYLAIEETRHYSSENSSVSALCGPVHRVHHDMLMMGYVQYGTLLCSEREVEAECSTSSFSASSSLVGDLRYVNEASIAMLEVQNRGPVIRLVLFESTRGAGGEFGDVSSGGIRRDVESILHREWDRAGDSVRCEREGWLPRQRFDEGEEKLVLG